MRTRMSLADLLLVPCVLGVAALLWYLHANAWDLGGRSPLLGYDSAQVAVAARELSFHGHFATPFALPIELVHQGKPPWPLAAVQPGLVMAEAALFKLVPPSGVMAASDARAWLTLVIPFGTFLLLAGSLALAVWHLYRRWAPHATAFERHGAALTLGLMFALDPEAQHFAIGGVNELPFTAGLLFVLLGLALAHAQEVPFGFGLVLGLAGLFRSHAIGLLPVFVLGASALAPPGRRVRVLLLTLAGFVLPMAPWWLYKWRAFGDPGWDLGRYLAWDTVQGRTWFSLYHLPALPGLPGGPVAWSLLARKVMGNLPPLLLDMTTGLRALWAAAIVCWLLVVRPPRPLAIGALAVLACAAGGVLWAALEIPWLRELFPSRILLECAGLLGFWALIAGLPEASLGPGQRRWLSIGAAGLALGWGGWQTARGLEEARVTAVQRGVPSTSSFTELSILINQELAAGEPVMSNLGPALAWQTNHPIVHLALTPDDVEACRRRLDFHVILLVFREPEHAWPGWNEIMERPGAARTIPRLGAAVERRYRSPDGFTVVWIGLDPLPASMAGRIER